MGDRVTTADSRWQFDRVRQLVRDWMPAWKAAEALALLDAVERGLTPRTVPCEACGGKGAIVVSRGNVPCPVCGGSGVNPEPE